MMERTREMESAEHTLQASIDRRSLQRKEQSTLANAAGESTKVMAPAPRVSNAPLLGKVGREEIYDTGR